jgi:hypothetical protein
VSVGSTVMRRAMAAVVLMLVTGISAWAGQAAGRGAPDRPTDVPDPGEVNRLFDAYAIMQAQEMLQIDDGKFGAFVTRLKALQAARRQSLRARGQLVRDLQRLLRQPDSPPDEGTLKERLDALARQDAAAALEIARAAAAVDELLDTRQRARFRVFEYQLELKKLELLARVRQQIRANRARP